MRSYPLIVALLAATVIQAQNLDSVDNIVFKIPKNWQAVKQPEFTQLMAFSLERYCQLFVHQKQAASADKQTSFEREWSNLVLASFDAATTALPQSKKLSSGQNVLYFGAQAVNRMNNQPCYVELNMFDCGSSVQSAVLVSANKQHLQFFDSSWQSLIAVVRSTGEEGVVGVGKFPFTGKWGDYDFKPNGNYTFHDGVVAESGSYSIIDRQLVIMPVKNPRRIYTWELNETVLALTPQNTATPILLIKK